MSICNGCGGVLGRDCFNAQECEQITASMANDDSYNQGYHAAHANLMPALREARDVVLLHRRDVWGRIELRKIQAGIVTEGRMRAIQSDEDELERCDKALTTLNAIIGE